MNANGNSFSFIRYCTHVLTTKMNETFTLQPLKGDLKGVGDNPHLQQLQMLTNQMNESVKISSSNLNPLISFSASNPLLSTSLSNSLCNGQSTGSLSNPSNSNSCGNTFKENDKKLKDGFAIEQSTGLLQHDHSIGCTSSTANSASNTLSALNTSMINSSLNSPKGQCNAFETPYFNFPNNIIADSMRVSNSTTSDYFIPPFNEDNPILPIETTDCLLNKSSNYQFSPPVTGSNYESTFHNLTSNPLATYNSQMSTSSFLNGIGSINSSSLNSSHLLTNLQGHSLLPDDNLGQNGGYENQIALNSSLQLPSLAGSASTNGYSFHNLQNLEPLTAQTAHTQLEVRANHLESSPSPSMTSHSSNHLSSSGVSNSAITVSSSSFQFTGEQIIAMIEAMLKQKSLEGLNDFLETIPLRQSNSFNERNNENSNSPTADTSNSNDITNGQENNNHLSNHLPFGNLMSSTSVDLQYRSNGHYSNGGQSLALSTITNNTYNSNNMHSAHHSVYNSSGGQSANQAAPNDTVRTAAGAFYLRQLPFDRRTNEFILIARANIEFYRQEFKRLYKIMEENPFQLEHHMTLQNLWLEAHYLETAKTRKRKLGAVDKYRVRKKHTFPVTIWDGEERVYCFKEKSRLALKECYKVNK